MADELFVEIAHPDVVPHGRVALSSLAGWQELGWQPVEPLDVPVPPVHVDPAAVVPAPVAPVDDDEFLITNESAQPDNTLTED